MFRGDHWIQASRLIKKVRYLPQTVINCVYEYHLKRVDSELTLFAHFRFMNTSSGDTQEMRQKGLQFYLIISQCVSVLC